MRKKDEEKNKKLIGLLLIAVALLLVLQTIYLLLILHVMYSMPDIFGVVFGIGAIDGMFFGIMVATAAFLTLLLSSFKNKIKDWIKITDMKKKSDTKKEITKKIIGLVLVALVLLLILHVMYSIPKIFSVVFGLGTIVGLLFDMLINYLFRDKKK